MRQGQGGHRRSTAAWSRSTTTPPPAGGCSSRCTASSAGEMLADEGTAGRHRRRQGHAGADLHAEPRPPTGCSRQRPTTRARSPRSPTGQAGFYFQGEWEISTFQTAKMPFSHDAVPQRLRRRPVRRAGRLAHPGHPEAAAATTRQRLDRSLLLIKSMLDQSKTWAEGGHVPSWLPFRGQRRVQGADPAVQLRGGRRGRGLRPGRLVLRLRLQLRDRHRLGHRHRPGRTAVAGRRAGADARRSSTTLADTASPI